MKRTCKILLPLFLLLFVFTWSEVLSAENQKKKQGEKSEEKKTGGPNILFDELSYDFGKTPQNQVAKHTFKFKNTGSDVLIIEKVKAG